MLIWRKGKGRKRGWEGVKGSLVPWRREIWSLRRRSLDLNTPQPYLFFPILSSLNIASLPIIFWGLFVISGVIGQNLGHICNCSCDRVQLLSARVVEWDSIYGPHTWGGPTVITRSNPSFLHYVLFIFLMPKRQCLVWGQLVLSREDFFFFFLYSPTNLCPPIIIVILVKYFIFLFLEIIIHIFYKNHNLVK